MNERKCKNCEYCQKELPFVNDTDGQTWLYYCHGHAPKMVNDQARWPRVDPDDWCRKFTPVNQGVIKNNIVYYEAFSPLKDRPDMREILYSSLYDSVYHAYNTMFTKKSFHDVIKNVLDEWEDTLYIAD